MTTLDRPDIATERSYRIKGADGVELYVEETGNPNGRPVVFIHGFSQSGLTWSRQMHSDLERDLRLVALDIRGHGRSQRPHDAYGDPSLWADDVNAVITQLHLERPVLCGWSYGGVIIGDYLRAYGERAIGGVFLVDAISKLGETVMPFLGSEFVDQLPGMFSMDVEESIAAVSAFIRITVAGELSAEDFYRVLGYNCAVPPHVRQGLLSRTVDNDDVYARLTVPTVICQGQSDRVVLPSMAEHIADLVPRATVSRYEGLGHSPFAEDVPRFNGELLAFASTL
jgi:non-heme chloroperoxidase